jgi:hypothetical protein
MIKICQACGNEAQSDPDYCRVCKEYRYVEDEPTWEDFCTEFTEIGHSLISLGDEAYYFGGVFYEEEKS